MSDLTVVVTGAAGFIGRWVVAELLNRGHAVRGLDDLSNGSRANVAEFAEDQAFDLVEGDVREPADVRAVLDDDVTACIHLAARIDVQESLENPQSHFETNVVGTQHVLDACRAADVRLGLVGTCMVYDMADTGDGIDETHPVKPASPYAASKAAAEHLAEGYHHGFDLPVTILRPFNTYGPYQKTGMAGGVVSIFTQRDLAGEPLKVFGDGEQTRDFLYVTDCARFIVDATFDDAADGEVINAGTGEDIAIRDLAYKVAGDEEAVEFVEHHHPQSEVQALRCNPTKAHDLLGWEPEISLDEGLIALRDHLRESDDV